MTKRQKATDLPILAGPETITVKALAAIDINGSWRILGCSEEAPTDIRDLLLTNMSPDAKVYRISASLPITPTEIQAITEDNEGTNSQHDS